MIVYVLAIINYASIDIKCVCVCLCVCVEMFKGVYRIERLGYESGLDSDQCKVVGFSLHSEGLWAERPSTVVQMCVFCVCICVCLFFKIKKKYRRMMEYIYIC